MEVEAVDEGVLAKILIPAGTENVKVNSVIAMLAEEGEDASAVDAPKQDESSKPEPSDDEQTEEASNSSEQSQNK